MISFFQISDLHLFESKNNFLNNSNPYDNLKKTIEAINKQKNSSEFIVVSGDCSQDGSEQSYKYLRDFLDELKLQCFIIPGNHDDVNVMNTVFNCDWENGNVNYSVVRENCKFCFLDSTFPPNCFLQISESQLQWLSKELAESISTVIFMHHNPLRVDSKWLDDITHINNDGDKFLRLISEYKNVLAVLFGHVHQSYELEKNNISFISTPSTAYQFKPYSKDFAVQKNSPGFRKFTLLDGKLASELFWI